MGLIFMSADPVDSLPRVLHKKDRKPTASSKSTKTYKTVYENHFTPSWLNYQRKNERFSLIKTFSAPFIIHILVSTHFTCSCNSKYQTFRIDIALSSTVQWVWNINNLFLQLNYPSPLVTFNKQWGGNVYSFLIASSLIGLLSLYSSHNQVNIFLVLCEYDCVLIHCTLINLTLGVGNVNLLWTRNTINFVLNLYWLVRYQFQNKLIFMVKSIWNLIGVIKQAGRQIKF